MIQNLKALVRGTYDLQKLRIQTGLRIVANFKAKLGQEPSEKEGTLDDKAKKLLKKIRASYTKLTDGVAKFPRLQDFEGDELISDYTELCLVSQYDDLMEREEIHFKRMGKVIEPVPIWKAFLKDVKGVGPAMAGVLISEIDISKARYPSSLWQYVGVGVNEDGKGTSRRKEHLVESEYTDKEGNTKTKMGISFNPFLKSKLVGVLGGSFLRAIKRDTKTKENPMGTGEIIESNVYADIYNDYKHRLESHKVYKDVSKGHRHNMAIRYMIKMFLKDLYVVWRELEGVPVSVPYSEAKLGLKHKVA